MHHSDARPEGQLRDVHTAEGGSEGIGRLWAVPPEQSYVEEEEGAREAARGETGRGLGRGGGETGGIGEGGAKIGERHSCCVVKSIRGFVLRLACWKPSEKGASQLALAYVLRKKLS